MKIKLLAAATLLMTMVSTNVFAWGTTGHRIVTEIAEKNLTKKAKKNIAKLLDNQKLAYFANYPDFVKSNPNYKEMDSWHYLNLEADLTKEECFEAIENSTDKNLYKRALLLIDELGTKDKFQKDQLQEKLYYLIHMIGDAHQPMHMGRPSDLGGNKITVEYFGQRTNIHTVWDSKLVDDEKYSYTEYTEVLNVLTKDQKKSLQAGSIKDWLYESHLKANAIYKEVENNRTLRYEYQYNNKNILEGQLQRAGLRLAKILNEIYG